jgi:transcriptional regulator with XRE-family HTH domain
MDFDFGKNLKRICNEQGTSPTKVVVELGYSNSKVNMWNNGSLPKAEMLVKLAEKLNCSVMDFFKTEDEWETAQATPTNEDEEDILRVYRSLSRRSKHEFMSMVYTFETQEELAGDTENTQSSIG